MTFLIVSLRSLKAYAYPDTDRLPKRFDIDFQVQPSFCTKARSKRLRLSI
ncbi:MULTISPECIES: hypothetical protein [Cyanophyceae]|nr:hypothetical protein [Trichocoleus sp. FACHB-69]MBD1933076.1 hypothetical protein [Trichocoleus sp. FACHB-69]